MTSMAKVYEFDGLRPVIDERAFVHPDAVLVGDVIVGPNCYVAPTACLRGDFGRLILGDGASVQDGCVLHAFPGEETVVEADGHLGHGAILHGGRVGRNALVGMNSVVMDGAVVGENAFVGAMSMVPAGREIPPGALALGVPAKVMRQLSEAELAWKTEGNRAYRELAARSLRSLKSAPPLTRREPDRGTLVWPENKPLHRAKRDPAGD
jgi:phenylacetic acid degradation protein